MPRFAKSLESTGGAYIAGHHDTPFLYLELSRRSTGLLGVPQTGESRVISRRCLSLESTSPRLAEILMTGPEFHTTPPGDYVTQLLQPARLAELSFPWQTPQLDP